METGGMAATEVAPRGEATTAAYDRLDDDPGEEHDDGPDGCRDGAPEGTDELGEEQREALIGAVAASERTEEETARSLHNPAKRRRR